MSSTVPDILIVDDDEDIRRYLILGLNNYGFQTREADSGPRAIELCKEALPDLIIIDNHMPAMSGLEAVVELKKLGDVPFLFVSASDDLSIVQQAISAGAMGYIVKPIDLNQLVFHIETALMRHNDILRLTQAQQHLEKAMSKGNQVSIAVGLVMERFRFSHEEAESMLLKQAQKLAISVDEVADGIVGAVRQLNGAGKLD